MKSKSSLQRRQTRKYRRHHRMKIGANDCNKDIRKDIENSCRSSTPAIPFHSRTLLLVKYLICCFISFSSINFPSAEQQGNNIQENYGKCFRYNSLLCLCILKKVNIWHTDQNVSTVLHSVNLYWNKMYYIRNQNFPIRLLACYFSAVDILAGRSLKMKFLPSKSIDVVVVMHFHIFFIQNDCLLCFRMWNI